MQSKVLEGPRNRTVNVEGLLPSAITLACDTISCLQNRLSDRSSVVSANESPLQRLPVGYHGERNHGKLDAFASGAAKVTETHREVTICQADERYISLCFAAYRTPDARSWPRLPSNQAFVALHTTNRAFRTEAHAA